MIYPLESNMIAQLFTTSGWTITAAALFVISLVMPLLVAPVLLIGALVSGWLGYFRKEWGGRPPIIITVVSFIFLVVVLNKLYFAQ
jgi:hypothetical protein